MLQRKSKLCPLSNWTRQDTSSWVSQGYHSTKFSSVSRHSIPFLTLIMIYFLCFKNKQTTATKNLSSHSFFNHWDKLLALSEISLINNCPSNLSPTGVLQALKHCYVVPCASDYWVKHRPPHFSYYFTDY